MVSRTRVVVCLRLRTFSEKSREMQSCPHPSRVEGDNNRGGRVGNIHTHTEKLEPRGDRAETEVIENTNPSSGTEQASAKVGCGGGVKITLRRGCVCVCLKQLPHEVESIKLQKHTHAETWRNRVGTEAARAALCMTNHTQGHTLYCIYTRSVPEQLFSVHLPNSCSANYERWSTELNHNQLFTHVSTVDCI